MNEACTNLALSYKSVGVCPLSLKDGAYMNIEQFQQALQLKGISLSQQQLDQFETYYQLLVEWNRENEFNSYYR